MKYTKIVNADLVTPGLAPRRWIKVGGVEDRVRRSTSGTEWRKPVKFQGFKITQLTRAGGANFEVDREIMDALETRHGTKEGDQVVVRAIDVILPWDDPELNLPHNLAAYKGRRMFCCGNGREAQRRMEDGTWKAMDCPCPLLINEDAQKKQRIACKLHGSLYVILVDATEVGAAAVFKTTSRASIQGLLGAMAMIAGLTQGILRGLPLQLVFTQRETEHGVNPTVTLVYPGTHQALLGLVHQIADMRKLTSARVEDMERAQRRLLQAAPEDPADSTKAASLSTCIPRG